jgi:hypothetical protein
MVVLTYFHENLGSTSDILTRSKPPCKTISPSSMPMTTLSKPNTWGLYDAAFDQLVVSFVKTGSITP